MEVFSFGNGDFLFQIFTAIVGIMGDGSYQTLMRIAILLGFLFLAYQLMFSLNIVHISKSVVAYVLFFFIIHGIMFIPKTNVVIRDEIKNTQVVVNNVPYGVGMFAHIFTTVERGLTRMMENYFSTPNDIRFNRSGYAFSVMLLDSFKDVVPGNPYFKQTMDDYVENCFFHDVLWGDKDLQQVVFSNNLWSMMSPANSANKFTKVYSQSNPAGEGTACSNAYGSLSGQLGTISTEAINRLNSVLQTDIALKTPAVMNYLLGVSMSANQAVQQAVAANAVKSSFARVALHVGPGAGAIPYASALAEQQQRTSWTVAGDLSKKYIPIMRQVLEAFVYGLFPILFIMMITPFGSKYFRTYLTLLLWLLLWSPLFAIINLIVNVRANGVLSASYTYFGLGSMPYIYQSASELTAMAGYMAWMVPTMAFAIAKGSEYAITSLASSASSSASFTAKSAAHNITDTSAPDKIASFAATSEMFRRYGDEVSQGLAANTIYRMQQGMAMAGGNLMGSGIGDIRRVTGTEWSARNVDAQQLEQIAGRHGMSVSQAQALMSSDKYQMALTNAGTRKEFAEDFAKQHGTTPEAGYRFLAETQMAKDRAINQAWNGDVGAYANFLKAGYDLSIGQQRGLNEAAQAAGVNLKDYGQMTSFMEEMRKVGALDKFMSGEVSANDLRKMGAMGLLSEKGMAEAAERMSQALGISYDQARANLLTREGLNEYAKFADRMQLAGMLYGKPPEQVTDSEFYELSKSIHASGSLTLTNPKWVNNLNQAMEKAGYKNFSAKRGDRVSVAFDHETGKFSMAYAERGGKTQTYDVSGIDKGRRHRIGDDIKLGNDIQNVDINKTTVDHTYTERTGSDIERLDRNVSTVDRGTLIGGTALQMALRGDPAMYKGVVSAYQSNDFAKTNAEISQTSAKIMEGLRSYVETAGQNAHRAIGEAFLQLGMRGSALGFVEGKAGVGGRMQMSSDKTTTVNLMTKALDEVQTRALKEGERLGYSGKALQSHVAAKTAQFVNSWKSFATSNQEFGAAKPSDMLNKAISSEAGKPYPSASTEEKNRRADNFRSDMEKRIRGK